MISWKYSFEKIDKDLELARKKKQALDDLFNSGKISASTYESLDKELTGIISEIEARQKDLADKMTSKIADLENQIGTLEMFLANSEIQYVAGEIDDELHASESNAFSSGLDAVKKQLVAIKEVVTSLMPEVVAPPPLSTPSETEEAP
ncbi:CdvA-like protein, partial [Candidatus Bathyarchaeota archaeon]|nr:CdvA-like protein [Candidatus Bathyarchaeota archaeon]